MSGVTTGKLHHTTNMADNSGTDLTPQMNNTGETTCKITDRTSNETNKAALTVSLTSQTNHAPVITVTQPYMMIVPHFLNAYGNLKHNYKQNRIPQPLHLRSLQHLEEQLPTPHLTETMDNHPAKPHNNNKKT